MDHFAGLDVSVRETSVCIVDDTGTPDPSRIVQRCFDLARSELTKKFGGLTAYSRAPAKGFWKNSKRTERDDILIFEVMVQRLNARWWNQYRGQLEKGSVRRS